MVIFEQKEDILKDFRSVYQDALSVKLVLAKLFLQQPPRPIQICILLPKVTGEYWWELNPTK